MSLRLAPVLGVALLALGAQATGVHCNPDLLEAGDSESELLRRCGPPLSRVGVAPEDVSGPTMAVEQWTYSVGPGTLVRVVTLANGLILTIEDGDPPAAQPAD